MKCLIFIGCLKCHLWQDRTTETEQMANARPCFLLDCFCAYTYSTNVIQALDSRLEFSARYGGSGANAITRPYAMYLSIRTTDTISHKIKQNKNLFNSVMTL